MIAKESTTENTRRSRKSTPPELKPALLKFVEDENFVSDGLLVLTATYPSRTRKGLLHRVTVRGDGSFVDCSCDGYRGKNAKCFHQAAAPEIATEYRRREYRALDKVDLRREDSWYAHLPADSLDASQRICRDALFDVVAERYIARYGRVEAATEEVSA